MRRFRVPMLFIASLIVAFIAGYLFAGGFHRPEPSSITEDTGEEAVQIFTCSMHPQVRLMQPGNCPICEMPLILLGGASASGDGAPVLSFSDHAISMMGVETVPVEYRDLSRNLRAVGKIQYNESSLATVTARVDGYAEKLFVSITGVPVKAGDHLVEVYSPDLIVAQQELLIALQNREDEALIETSKLKLRRWGLTEQQVEELVKSRKLTDRATLYSPIAGTVIEKTIFENSAFRAGDVLYRIANLDTVWAYLDIYESDLAWIRYGQQVELAAEAYPGQLFTGMVTFVEPVLNEQTRTVRVPVHVENKDQLLKPGMYVSAVVKAGLGPDGRAAPTGAEGKFTCPMHPQILEEKSRACPMCGMPLEQILGAPKMPDTDNSGKKTADRYACPMACEGQKTYNEPGNCPVCLMRLEQVDGATSSETPASSGLLSIPASAVLDSGTRHLVYIEKGKGAFESRTVILGPKSGDYFPVLHGLSAGERVVAHGGFLIDSQFQITGHPSLFYPGGLHAASGQTSGETGTDVPSTEASSSEDSSNDDHHH